MRYDSYGVEIFNKFLADLVEQSKELEIFDWEISRLRVTLGSRIAYAKEILDLDSYVYNEDTFEYSLDIILSTFELPIEELPKYVNCKQVLMKFIVHWRLEKGV